MLVWTHFLLDASRQRNPLDGVLQFVHSSYRPTITYTGDNWNVETTLRCIQMSFVGLIWT
uniref:Uncharacterized protein n=1 Tax=Arundo donax TaxID=35708 RepID=A0A0A9A9U3_ARUDO